MKLNPDVYLFGQVLGTHSFLLKDGFLQPDEYSEIAGQYFLPGGETGTAATVLASLGAGDTFKAGCVYALLHGMKDEDLVRFAAACSAIAVSRFPLPLNPPKPDEVQALIKNGKNTRPF